MPRVYRQAGYLIHPWTSLRQGEELIKVFLVLSRLSRPRCKCVISFDRCKALAKDFFGYWVVERELMIQLSRLGKTYMWSIRLTELLGAEMTFSCILIAVVWRSSRGPF